MLAAERGNAHTLQLLLDLGADVSAADHAGTTALHIAASTGRVDIVRILIRKGASTTTRDIEGQTPVDRAVRTGNVDVVGAVLSGTRVTLHIDGAGVADAFAKLLMSCGAACPVQSGIPGSISLSLTNVPYAVAFKSLVAAAGTNLNFRYADGKLVIARQVTDEHPAELVAEPVHTSDPHYRFFKTISKDVLNNYLSRAVTHYGLCSISPEPETQYFEDDLRMLTSIGAKFIGRVAYAWVPPDDDEAHFRLAAERAERVHRADPEVILQAAVFEAVYESVGRIPVPEWVFVEFKQPVEKRNFKYEAMLYGNGKFRDQWTKGASVPDMSKLETRMYFYYRARRYIEAGCESIHFGQIGLMDQNDVDHHWWMDMLTRVRAYAAGHARRRMVLCDAHTHGASADGRLLFDFHAWPLMSRDVLASPQKEELVVGFKNSIYGHSDGGVTPSGWQCDSLPYLCEFDCGGSSNKPGTPVGFPWNWGYDCGSWFAHQSQEYRAEYMGYARRWLRARNENAWLQMPTRLNLAIPVDGHKMWQGNTRSKACPEGYNEEPAIKAIWDQERVQAGPK